MTRLTQAELQRHFESVVVNGKLPAAQAVLSTIGYDPPVLDAYYASFQDWLSHKRKAQALLAMQKEATEAEHLAIQAAQAQMTDLNQTIRVIFKGDVGVLTASGLLPHHHSSGTEPAPGAALPEPGSSPQPRRIRGRSSTATKVAGWQLTLTNIQTFSEEKKARLERAGWPAERLAAAAEKVEACIRAHNVQMQCTQEYQAEFAAARTAEKKVREQQREFVRLVGLGIQRADPNNQQQLSELLGL